MTILLSLGSWEIAASGLALLGLTLAVLERSAR